MKSASQILSVCIFAVLLAGCKPENGTQPQRTPNGKLVAAAKAIVSNPNNWKANSSSLTDFIDAAAELNISDKAEVKDFKTNATELIMFGTTWISNLDEAESHKLKDGVTRIVAGINTKVPSGQNAAEVQIDANNVQRYAVSVLGSSTTKLTPKQAELFGKLFVKAVDSYEKICNLAR